MNLDDLRKKYTEDELSWFPGDDALRYEAFSPLLANLHEGKVVYGERFVCLVQLADVKIDAEGFSAVAHPLMRIERGGPFNPPGPVEPWEFGGTWGWMVLSGSHIHVPYAGWSIWFEPERVKEVERLLLAGDHRGALELTLNEEEEDAETEEAEPETE